VRALVNEPSRPLPKKDLEKKEFSNLGAGSDSSFRKSEGSKAKPTIKDICSALLHNIWPFYKQKQLDQIIRKKCIEHL